MGLTRNCTQLALLGTLSLAGCTSLDGNIASRVRALCFAPTESSGCGCARATLGAIVPPVPSSGPGLEEWRSLAPYLAQAPNGSFVHQPANISYTVGSVTIGNHFMGPGFFLQNWWGDFVVRNSTRVNNFIALVSHFSIVLPSDPAFAPFAGVRINPGVLSTAGGVELSMRQPGQPWMTVISATGHHRSRYFCARSDGQTVWIELSNTPTEFRLIQNIAAGDSATYNTSATGRGAPGALAINGLFRSPLIPGLLPEGDPATVCNRDFYLTDDPQRPSASLTTADLVSRGVYTVPKEYQQMRAEDRTSFGLPVCGHTE